MRLLLMTLLAFAAFMTSAGERPAHLLTLEQAIANVLEKNPELQSAVLESSARVASAHALQLKPATRTSIELENFGGNGSKRGSSDLETTLSLTSVLESGNKTGLRSEIAQNSVAVFQDELDAHRLDLMAETARRFIQLVADQARLEIANESLELAQRLRRFVDNRVQAGKASRAELRTADIDIARKSLQLEHTRLEKRSSTLKLVSLWGETDSEPEAAADLFAIEPALAFETLAAQLEHNPDLVRYVNNTRLAEAQLQLARLKQHADIEITGGIRYFNQTDDSALILSMNIPLGSSPRAKPLVDEASQQYLRKPYEYQARKLDLYSILFDMYQELTHSIHSVETLQNTIIPQAELVLQDYEKGYTNGRYSQLELARAQSSLIESRLEALNAAADYHRYKVEIDRLTGAGLSTGANP